MLPCLLPALHPAQYRMARLAAAVLAGGAFRLIIPFVILACDLAFRRGVVQGGQRRCPFPVVLLLPPEIGERSAPQRGEHTPRSTNATDTSSFHLPFQSFLIHLFVLNGGDRSPYLDELTILNVERRLVEFVEDPISERIIDSIQTCRLTGSVLVDRRRFERRRRYQSDVASWLVRGGRAWLLCANWHLLWLRLWLQMRLLLLLLRLPSFRRGLP
mmetsp:Transcript_63223/g.186898  ORF Transcript_63223/g.186898 Transcript_63223/m.186898 type:complete len:215 (-) Transcript_63223:268-912(-)